MGERSNIVIKQFDGSRVYLYGHWMGPHAIYHALKGLESGRATDETYLARVIFSSMVKDDIDGETGYGIGTYPSDNEYPIIVIDPDNQTVELEGTQWNPGTSFPPVSFETFRYAAKTVLEENTVIAGKDGQPLGDYESLAFLVNHAEGGKR